MSARRKSGRGRREGERVTLVPISDDPKSRSPYSAQPVEIVLDRETKADFFGWPVRQAEERTMVEPLQFPKYAWGRA
jgi:hypothetical protein